MDTLNKIDIYRALLQNDDFVHYAHEESIIRDEMNKEMWMHLSPLDKQKRRIQFLESGKKSRSVINLLYYEKMIHVYSLIIDLLSFFDKKNQEQQNTNKSIEISFLRIVALLLVEQRLIDEQINPSYHIPPIYFKNVIEKNVATEKLKILIDFLQHYSDMFEEWPEKAKYKSLFLRK